MIRSMLLLLLATGLLAGCGAPRALTLDEARGQCFTQTGGADGRLGDDVAGGSCGETRAVCESFLDRDVLPTLSRAECRKTCAEKRDAMLHAHTADGCWPVAKQAYDLCDMYCRAR